MELRNKVVGKVHDDIPEKLFGNEDAMAYFGILKLFFETEKDVKGAKEIDDYFYDELKAERGVELSLDQMDEIIEKVLQVARHRMTSDSR